MSGTTTTHRVAQATPQNSWTRAGQSAATALSQYAGAVKTDASFCAINSTEETVANFADDGAEAPHWVVDLPSASFVTHRVFMGVTVDSDSIQLLNMGCSIGLAYFRQSRDNKSFSPEVFATIDCYLTADAIPLTDEEKAKYLPSDAPNADWYWVSTYTPVRNAAHGFLSIAASVPPSFRYDFNGNAYVAISGDCVKEGYAADETSRGCIACGVVTAAQ